MILFDLTSTYFEVDGTKVLDSDLQRYGYSRDKRGDCLQVVIALVLTPDGFPLAYEVLPGNTNDRETQMPFIERLEKKYGKIGSLWLMDRGVPTERTLERMRESGYRYLVGAPRGHMRVIGDGEIEYAFRELKNDLGLRPVYHQLDDRIESHIFTSFMALCLFQTLRAIARNRALSFRTWKVGLGF